MPYDPDCDLVQRLARFRQRLESEGRFRSLRLIDRAIENALNSGNVEIGQAIKEDREG
jgi:hypothetical protein